MEEGVMARKQVFMAKQQAAVMTVLNLGVLRDPAVFVTPHPASVFMASHFDILLIGLAQFDSAILEPPARRSGAVAGVDDQPEVDA